MTTHLYLIRHGQAEGLQADINGTLVPNAGLSATGVKQAQCLRERLATTVDIKADVLISSPLRRARETAQIIAPALGLTVLIDEDLPEINLSEAEGLTDEQISERFGLFHLEHEPFRRIAQSGESLASFHVRACSALDARPAQVCRSIYRVSWAWRNSQCELHLFSGLSPAQISSHCIAYSQYCYHTLVSRPR